MAISAVIFITCGCYLLYCNSSGYNSPYLCRLVQQAREYPRWSKAIAVFLLLLSSGMLVSFLGFWGGVLLWLFLLSSIMSLVVLITPLKVISYQFLSFIFFIAFVLQMYITYAS